MAAVATSIETNPMRKLLIAKLVLNIGVGRSGESIERARLVIEDLAGQKPCSRDARESIRDFGVRKGEPIGVMATIRGERAETVLRRLLEAKSSTLPISSFDGNGSISFGLREHIEIPGVRYDPDIGIFGLNASVLLERPASRVKRRHLRRTKVGKRQRVNQDESITYFRENFRITVT